MHTYRYRLLQRAAYARYVCNLQCPIVEQWLLHPIIVAKDDLLGEAVADSKTVITRPRLVSKRGRAAVMSDYGPHLAVDAVDIDGATDT